MHSESLEKPDTSNYFSFYGFPSKFELSAETLKQAFLEKSKIYHPDFYANDPQSYNLALMASAYNNLAYKTLSSEISRAQYLLELHSSSENKLQLPQTFLMEMLELNEAIDELNEQNRYELEDKIDAYRKHTLTGIRNFALNEDWEHLQILMLEWKYLERLKERLID